MFYCQQEQIITRGGYRTLPISKMDLFVIIAKGWEPLTIATKSSILDVKGVLGQALPVSFFDLRDCLSTFRCISRFG